MVTEAPGGAEQNPAYRPTHHHHQGERGYLVGLIDVSWKLPFSS